MKSNKRIAWLLMVLIAFAPIVHAGPFVSGQVLTASQLNTVVDSKTDNSAAAITGGTVTGVTINNSVIGSTTPAAIYNTNTIAISAAGTTQGTATALTSQFNKVTTAAVGSGVVLFAPARAGLTVAIDNDTANSLNVYPQVGGSIDSLGANNPMVVPPNGSIILVSADTLTWDSYLSTDQVFNSIRAYGTITPNSASGIIGTATSDNVQAGSVGEYLTASAASSAVSLTTASSVSLTSVSLTAGDWDVQGTCVYQAAATTSITQDLCGISTVSNVLSTDGTYVRDTFAAVVPGAVEYKDMPTMSVRVSLGTTTTVYLVGQSTFTVSTQTAGGVIRARRVR